MGVGATAPRAILTSWEEPFLGMTRALWGRRRHLDFGQDFPWFEGALAGANEELLEGDGSLSLGTGEPHDGVVDE
jgi:hypothetical protein